ncbi:MAG: hypothetical protein PHP79_04365 [Clostridia bacterium]|nr:hypothetical protein [Clostridia bacterium]
MKSRSIIKNASDIVTCIDSEDDGIIENDYIIIRDAMIKSIGTGAVLLCLCADIKIIDAKSKINE